jgi:hypothetical protein
MTEFFPEPTAPDETWGTLGEQPVEWLMRSTLPRAVSIRRALNDNLNRFPQAHARSLARKLRTAFQSHYFELIVGRYLQEMGAGVEPSPLGSNGTRIDYRATFPDGVLSVEAVSKIYNRGAAEELDGKRRVVALIEKKVPPRWGLLMSEVPSADDAATDEFETFVNDSLASLPTDPRPEERIGFAHAFRSGDLNFTAVAVPPRISDRILVGPGVSFMDNSQVRIRDAMRHARKRAQARGAQPPAILAIDGGILAADLEDFDVALLGSGVQHMGIDGGTVGFSFDAAGEMSKDASSPWAAVLAFIDVGVFRANEPVLYVSPHYRGNFPRAFLRLERRELAIRTHRAPGPGWTERIAFGNPADA